jgi:putative membrane protein
MRAKTLIASAVATLSVFWLVSLAAAQQRDSTQQKESGQQRDATQEKGAAKQRDAASSLSRGDRKFIQKVAESGQAEVELGRLAEKKAMSNAVKQFGRRMAADHAAAGQELKQLASSKGVQIEDKAAGKHERMIEKLNRLQANQFDREYVKAMVKEHKNDVAEFRKISREAADPKLRAWVNKTLPALEDHLQTIEGIQAQL